MNGEDITQRMLSIDVERERQRIMVQMGEQFDPALIDSGVLQSSVLEQAISRLLLEQSAQDMGMGTSQGASRRGASVRPNLSKRGWRF